MIKYIYKEGQTPINEEEKQGLIPILNTQEELNLWEQENIIEARKWFEKNSFNNTNIFDLNFLKKVHKKMFDKTWIWAGILRKSDKNIGCPFYEIESKYKELEEDALYWLKNKTYSIKELALIFHHRLVKIHLFSNGNGRHARLIADIIIKKHNHPPLKWIDSSLTNDQNFRKQYIKSLKLADNGDYSLLLKLF